MSKCLIIGHKGVKPGNTADSFKKAVELGVNMIELDVRVTKDGVPIIVHDKDIKNFLIKDTSLRQLKTIESDILTLIEAIALCGEVPLLIDVKPRVDCKPILTVLKSLPAEMIKGYQIASSDRRVLKKFLKEMPELGRVVSESWSGVRAAYKARSVKTKYLSMRSSCLWSYYIRAITKPGRDYVLYAYTLNSPKKANRWIKAGLGGIITDYPDKFIKTNNDA